MIELKPFAPIASIRVFASFSTGNEWRLNFKLEDPIGYIVDSLQPGQWANWSRADELWKTTCLEAFWGVPGDPAYWEFNLSPSRQQWNLYHFDNYRQPQPPQPSDDFELTKVSATRDTLECILLPKKNLTQIELSLTAIVRTSTQSHYFAINHAGTKPDFHLRASFGSC